MMLTCALVLLLAACHRKPPADEAGAASRRLTVEAYDAPIPKAPLKGKRLETMSRPPVMAPPPASDAPVEPASSMPPA